MPVYVETQDVTKPAGSRDRSLGDDDIREMKRAECERQNEDHVRPADETGETMVGYHRKSQYKAQASDPVAVAGTGIIYTKDVGSGVIESFYRDAAGNVIQLTSGGKLNAAALGGVYAAANVAAVANILGFVYPVGSIVTLGVATNPGTLFGIGTWTAITGKVIVGLDPAQTEFDTLDETGGAKTHTLSISEMPAHDHSGSTVASRNNNSAAGTADSVVEAQATNDSVPLSIASQGGGGAHNNLQPYIVKYVWQRTA